MRCDLLAGLLIDAVLQHHFLRGGGEVGRRVLRIRRSSTSMPRLARRSFRMSSICLSWKSTCARIVTVNSFSSKLAPVSLKSKRWLDLAIGLVDGVGHFVRIELGNDIERGHAMLS